MKKYIVYSLLLVCLAACIWGISGCMKKGDKVVTAGGLLVVTPAQLGQQFNDQLSHKDNKVQAYIKIPYASGIGFSEQLTDGIRLVVVTNEAGDCAKAVSITLDSRNPANPLNMEAESKRFAYYSRKLILAVDHQLRRKEVAQIMKELDFADAANSKTVEYGDFRYEKRIGPTRDFTIAAK